MADKIEFIPANELPVAEGDEVSVLCLENGVLKQKAASGLGGDNYDAIIKIEEDYSSGNDICNITVEKGILDDVIAMIRVGKRPKILFYGAVYYGQTLPIVAEPFSIVVHDNADTEMVEVHFDILWTYGSGWTYRYTYKWSPNGVEYTV